MSGKNQIYTLGASNHSDKERARNDYYGTNPEAVDSLLANEIFSEIIWEPTAGHHNIVNRLEAAGYTVRKSDLVDYGFGDEQLDFLEANDPWNNSLILNPPYVLANEFIEHALEIVTPGNKIAAFLRLQFLEGQKRYDRIFKNNPPIRIYVFVKRQVCSAKDDFSESSAVAYIWAIWEKGFSGNPKIHWISPVDKTETKEISDDFVQPPLF